MPLRGDTNFQGGAIACSKCKIQAGYCGLPISVLPMVSLAAGCYGDLPISQAASRPQLQPITTAQLGAAA
jgi:hypothetical protein